MVSTPTRSGRQAATPVPPPIDGRRAAAMLSALRDAAALLRHGRAGEAVQAYRRIVKSDPDNPEAHHNLGVALRADGHGDDAIMAYRRALELRPGYAAAHHHLAQALDAAQRPMEALKHHFQAFRLASDRTDFAQALAQALRPIRLKSASPAVIEGLIALFAAPDIDRQDLMAVTASLLLARDDLTAPALAQDALFHLLLRETIVADERVERLIASLRRALLEQFVAQGTLEHPPLAASIACQGFVTDFALPVAAEEQAQLDALAASAADPSDLLLVRAMYGTADAQAAERIARADDTLALVLARHVDEPAHDRALMSAIQAVTPIDDGVSAAVRAQYEENPYPRWRSITRRPARSLAEVVTSLFATVDASSIPPPPHRILVAGSGTGRHALNVAFRYADATVLAIDLSRASLAYGMRRARELGVDTLRFRHADILHLGTIDERFDLIETSGVLHHMEDPIAGWRVLTGLLKPGGFIKLGLYSRTGRQTIEAARRFVAERGFPATADGIRAAREAIRALGPDEPVRKVADELDFASISGCRDLLFHVQEQSFTLPQIASAIADLNLAFLGFELADESTRAAYAKLYPEDRERTDLARWQALEETRPATFRTMYQFWCRKP
jgi:SAM-dependent methyltransferase